VAEAATGHARTAGEAAEAQAYGLTADTLRDWASFSPIEIYWALKHDVTPAAARRWAREGLRICDTVRAIALGMIPEEIRQWAGAGFTPFDAVEAKEMGVTLETAVAWREAGFILPDAALLIDEGWTLQEAVNARYKGIPAEDRRPSRAGDRAESSRPGDCTPAAPLPGWTSDSVTGLDKPFSVGNGDLRGAPVGPTGNARHHPSCSWQDGSASSPDFTSSQPQVIRNRVSAAGEN
jgi:hypothetical protein